MLRQTKSEAVPLALDLEDIEVGQSQLQADGSWKFQPGVAPFTAVRINSLMSDAKSSGSVSLFFADSFGIGDFTPTKSAVASQFDHEIVLCVDRSHSMCFDFSGDNYQYPDPAADPGWLESSEEEPTEEGGEPYYCHRPHVDSRWGGLTAAVNVFLNSVESNNAHEQQRIGLVTWGSEYPSRCTGTTFPASSINAEIGLNFNQIRTAMQQLGSQAMSGGTNMSAGLNAAIDLLTGSGANPLAKKTIILFTDGQWTVGDPPSSVSSTAAANNITIHIVTLLDNLDMTEMDGLAGENGGIHYNASTEAELIAAFDALARSMPVALTE